MVVAKGFFEPLNGCVDTDTFRKERTETAPINGLQGRRRWFPKIPALAYHLDRILTKLSFEIHGRGRSTDLEY